MPPTLLALTVRRVPVLLALLAVALCALYAPDTHAFFPHTAAMARSLKNPDGTVDREAMIREIAYVKGKYAQNRANAERNLGYTPDIFKSPEELEREKKEKEPREAEEGKAGASGDGAGEEKEREDAGAKEGEAKDAGEDK